MLAIACILINSLIVVTLLWWDGRRARRCLHRDVDYILRGVDRFSEPIRQMQTAMTLMGAAIPYTNIRWDWGQSVPNDTPMRHYTWSCRFALSGDAVRAFAQFVTCTKKLQRLRDYLQGDEIATVRE